MTKSISLCGVLSVGIMLALLFMLPVAVRGAPPADAQTSIVVDTLDDEEYGDGDCSLREAIRAANSNIPVDACPGGSGVATDTITFAEGGKIILNDQLEITPGGPLVVDGGGLVTVSANNQGRVFYINADVHITLKGMTIADGTGGWDQRRRWYLQFRHADDYKQHRGG